MRPCAPFHAVAALAIVLAACPPVWAKDLGVRGETWPIAEPDLLAQIEARLNEMDRSGELARLQGEARARARASVQEPQPVSGIAPARRERTRLFDPSITVERDIRAADGTLIAAAGTRIDPFAHGTFAGRVLFIDGRRDAEIAWALELAGGGDRPSKIVLLAGRPLELARRHGRPFFFDQGGRIARRLGLAFTPALVRRDGAHLRITEFPLDDRDTGARPSGGNP